MRIPMTVLLVLGVMAGGAAQADIHKCTDKTGRKFYQDRPCAADQQADRFDPEAGTVTTIDSEASRREMQGVLTTREQSRERRVEVTTPAAAPDTQVTITGPDTPYGEDDGGYLDGYRDGYYDGDYPNHGPRRPHRDHDDRPGHGRPDETPVVNPPRRISGYAPAPPSIRQVAPRPPSSRPLPGNRGSATVPPNTPRDDERRGPP